MRNKLIQLGNLGETKKQAIVGAVVENAKKVESSLELLLTTYISPKEEKYEFVRNILLSNFFLDFGKKVNLLNHINISMNWFTGKEKNDFFNKLRAILRTRNAFAHDFGQSSIGETTDSEITFNYKVRTFQNEDFKVLEYTETVEKYTANCNYVLEKLYNITDKLLNPDE